MSLCDTICRIIPCCDYMPCFRSSRRQSAYEVKAEKVGNVNAARDGSDTQDPLRRMFNKFSGSDEGIDAFQLRDLMNIHFNQLYKMEEGFSTDICRSMIAMKDNELSGKLRYEEFYELSEDVKKCKEEFDRRDLDEKGYFDNAEFSDILSSLGMPVSEKTVQCLTARYSDRGGRVRFNDFVSCALRLKLMTDTFKSQTDENGTKGAAFSKEEFLLLAIYS